MPKETAATRRRTANKKKLFLKKMYSLGFILPACRAANVGRSTVYEWQKKDPEFKAALDEIELENVERVESGVFVDALAGDNKCRELYLKARKPEYRERYDLNHVVDDEIAKLLEALAGGSEGKAAGGA